MPIAQEHSPSPPPGLPPAQRQPCSSPWNSLLTAKNPSLTVMRQWLCLLQQLCFSLATVSCFTQTGCLLAITYNTLSVWKTASLQCRGNKHFATNREKSSQIMKNRDKKACYQIFNSNNDAVKGILRKKFNSQTCDQSLPIKRPYAVAKMTIRAWTVTLRDIGIQNKSKHHIMNCETGS